MAPVVHGLAKQYEGRVDFLYLDMRDGRNGAAMQRLGFESTPHFFFLRRDGTPVEAIHGVVPADSVRGALDRLLAASGR
jgi:thioredoxin-like negative regulator of GroEL